MKTEAIKKKQLKAASSTPTSGRATPVPGSSQSSPIKKKQQPQNPALTQLQADVEGLGLDSGRSTPESTVSEEKEEKIVQLPKEEIMKEIEKRQKEGKPVLSLVVIGRFPLVLICERTDWISGHVDAGKSTLMGRVLHDLGEITDRAVQSNQRQSQKLGKGSFAYAWTFDALPEERERYD